MSESFLILGDLTRQRAAKAVLSCPDGWVVSVGQQTRTNDQNSLLWPLLAEISAQVVWYGQKLTKEEWKDVMTAALKKEKVVPGINGGFVVLGQHTSKMTKAEFSELIEFIYAFAAQQGVNLTPPEAA